MLHFPTEVFITFTLNIRHLLKELASRTNDSGDFHLLITSLAQIIAAKPHSADAEHLQLQQVKVKQQGVIVTWHHQELFVCLTKHG